MATSNLIVRVLAETSQLSRDLQKAQSSMARFETAVKRIGTTIAAAFTVDQVIQFGVEASKVAMEAEGVKIAFDKLNGVSLADLRRQTQGTFSDLQLMKSAVEFGNFNLPLNKLGTLLQFVQMRAAQTGKSFEHLRDSLIEGLAKESKLRIDNLGISLKDLNKEIERTGDFTTAVASIAEKEIGKMAGVTDTTKNSVQQLNAAWENFQVSVGNFVNSGGGGIIPMLTSLVQSIDQVVQIIAVLAKNFDAWDFVPVYLVGSFIDAANELNELNRQSEIQAGYNRDRKEAVDTFKSYVSRIKEANGGVVNLNKALEDQVSVLRKQQDLALINMNMDLAEVYNQQIDAIQKYVEALKKKNEETKTEIALNQQKMVTAAMPTGLNPQAPSQTAGIPQAPVISDIKAINPELMTLEERLKAVGKVAVEYGGMITDAVSGIAAAFGSAIVSGKGFGEAILQVFSGFMRQLGQMMIATGLAAEKFKKWLLAHPAAAVAAGIGLVALSAAFQSAAGSLVGNLGSAGGGGGGGASRSAAGGNAGGVLDGQAFKFYLNGKALKYAIDYEIKRESYTGGRGG